MTGGRVRWRVGRGVLAAAGADLKQGTTALLPTYSHTWVEPSEVTLGWLAGTRTIWDDAASESGHERRVAWDLFAAVREVAPGPCTMTVRSTYYRQGFAFDDGSASVLYEGIGRAAGGVLLSLRQRLFERLGPDGSLALVRLLSVGLHASRLDLAADGPAESLCHPSDLYSLLPAARSRSRRAHQVLTVDREGGEKLTIGSRASERYLRAYLKGEWVRHELELKQGAAGRGLAGILGGVALVDVWAAEYGRLIEWPLH